MATLKVEKDGIISYCNTTEMYKEMTMPNITEITKDLMHYKGIKKSQWNESEECHVFTVSGQIAPFTLMV